jgi:hypothetical protein
MGNKGREFLRDLKIKQRLEEDGLFPLSDEDREIDKKFGIKRKPHIGCLISLGGTIVFWSLLYIILTYLLNYTT